MSAFAGRVCAVTGGGTGIGAAIAAAFAEAGARVIVAGRRAEPLTEVAARTGALAVPTDLASEPAVAALFATVAERFGGLDVLVNNAGDSGGTLPVEELSAEDWDRTFAVNVRGPMLCIKYAMPLLKVSRGAIVSVASDSIARPKALRLAYAGSKRALVGLTKVVAEEAGAFGVRANVVAPGATESAMLRQVFAERAAAQGIDAAEVYRRSAAGKALRRLSRVEEVAAAVLFLAGDEARTITGTALLVDGGQA